MNIKLYLYLKLYLFLSIQDKKTQFWFQPGLV